MDGLFFYPAIRFRLKRGREREGHTKIDKEVGAGFVAVAQGTQARWKYLAQFHWGFRYKKYAREECYLDDGDNLTIEI